MIPARRISLVVAAVGATAFVVLAVVLVPWSPVPGGAPDPVAASSVFTAEQVARAESFAAWSRVWSWSSLAVSLIVAAVLGFTPLGARLVERVPGRWWWRVVLTVAALALLGRLLTLPFGLALHRHLVTNGLSTQSPGEYLVDVAKGQAVGIVVTSLVMLVLVGSARAWRRAWPAVAAAVLGTSVLVGSYVYPVAVEPLFNSFTPLEAGSLRSGVLDLAEREGVAVEEVLVADASRRTTTLNAYVSGLGGTRRVVVYDNLVESLPEDDALSVVAHELAHASYDDVLTGSVLGVAGVVAGVGLLGVVITRGRPGRRRPDLSDPAVVPLVAALVAVATLLASPVQNTLSRQVETRADVSALTATEDPMSFVAVQRRLALRSLADPTPPGWSHFWFGSHPTVLQRIAVAEAVAGPMEQPAD